MIMYGQFIEIVQKKQNVKDSLLGQGKKNKDRIRNMKIITLKAQQGRNEGPALFQTLILYGLSRIDQCETLA